MSRPRIPINVGEKYNRLTVVSIVDKTSTKEWHIWCQCDCGNKVKTLSSSVRSGHTKSCGCYKKEKIQKPAGETSFSSLYSTCAHQAAKRGLEFSLSREQHKSLVLGDCFYCGAIPKFYNKYLNLDKSIAKSAKGAKDIARASIYINGIDRVDNSQGYTIENSVSSCYKCNVGKWEDTIDDFIGHAYAIVAHQEKLKVEKIA